MISAETFKTWSIGLQASDRKAFAALFNTMRTPLFRYAWTFTQDEEVCYDILQEVFAKLWEVRHKLDEDRSLKALLYQMTRNKALNYLRDYGHRMVGLEGQPEPLYGGEQAVAAVIDAERLQDEVSRCVAALPERRREVFLLSRNEGLSHEEIAAVLDISPRTVNNHLGFALTELRSKLIAFYEGGTA